MRAIIFDVDNTLIDWHNEYIFVLKNLLLEINPNFTEKEILKIDNVIDTNEKFLTELNKDSFLKYINDKTGLTFDMNFLNNLIKGQGKCYKDDNELIETIKYLASKYDLFVISNWFTETQKLRLENLGIAKYFKKIIGGDENYFKPDTRCFDIILKDYKVDECVYVGDKLDVDIKPALSIGMDAIWKTNIETNEYKTIKNINDLRNIL